MSRLTSELRAAVLTGIPCWPGLVEFGLERTRDAAVAEADDRGLKGLVSTTGKGTFGTHIAIWRRLG